MAWIWRPYQKRLGHLVGAGDPADIYSHVRGRDQERPRRWDKFMRLHGGLSEEPHMVV